MDVRELAELLAQARQWQSLAAPGSEESYEGRDHTDSVTARVDASGALTSISVVDRWNRRLDADALGDAIREASAAAVSARYGFALPAPGAAAIDWGTAFDDVIALPPAPVVADDLGQAEAQVAEATAMIERETARVSIADARETYLSQVDKLLSHPFPSFDGRLPDVLGSPMQVELELSPAGQLLRCAVNSRWAGSQSGNALTMRLDELLAEYRDGK
jgi:DNA-binding protein YbaB